MSGYRPGYSEQHSPFYAAGLADSTGRRFPTTTLPFRQWAWHERLIEKLYRCTHNGQIRTLVVSEGWRELRQRMGQSDTEWSP